MGPSNFLQQLCNTGSGPSSAGSVITFIDLGVSAGARRAARLTPSHASTLQSQQPVPAALEGIIATPNTVILLFDTALALRAHARASAEDVIASR